MKRRFSKGFSLTEVAIAIFIMVMGVVWVYSAINDMIRVSNNAVSRLEAGFLATEGMEFIKNKRDANFIDYLNNKGQGDCVDPNTNRGRCWWGHGFLDGSLSNSKTFANLDVSNGVIAGTDVFLEATNLPSKCQPIASKIVSNNTFKECAEEIYSNDNDFARLKKDENGRYGYWGENSSTTIYKRVIIVSPMGGGSLFQDDFQGKYSLAVGSPELSPTCQQNTVVAEAGDVHLQDSNADRLRIDSFVIWNISGKVEFIHLVTYLFNWHGLI